jgi:uracil phosphoribosyltransferase
MRVHVANHPLITHKLSLLRDKSTPSSTFRALATELAILLAPEATSALQVTQISVETPVATTTGAVFSNPKPLLVPILRAGLGLLDGMLMVLPSAEVGFLGMVRNEETLKPSIYSERVPADLRNRQCIVLDPMLATGGSLIAAVNYLFDNGAADVTAMCLLAAPEGVAALEKAVGDRPVTLVVGCIDERLNELGYIIPGLGDAGDRLYGTV